MASADLEQQNLLRMKRAKIFVEQTVTYTSTELLNSITALAHHPALVAALGPPRAPAQPAQRRCGSATGDAGECGGQPRSPPLRPAAAARPESGERVLRRFFRGKQPRPGGLRPESIRSSRRVLRGKNMPRWETSTASWLSPPPSRCARRVAAWSATWWR